MVRPQVPCVFTMPVVVYSLHPVRRKQHWERLAAQHGVQHIEVRPAVDATDANAMRHWAPALLDIISSLPSRSRRKSDIATPTFALFEFLRFFVFPQALSPETPAW